MIFLLILCCFIAYSVYCFWKKDFKHIPVLLFIGLILVAGLRKDYGFDYANYFVNWNEINTISDVLHSSFDKGYTLLVLCFKQLHLGFYSFLLFIAFVSIGLKYKVINKLSPLPFLSFFIYYLLFFIINDMEQIRHGLAIAICLYALIYVIEKKPVKYLFCCLGACLLHSSAILFLPLFLFRKVNLNTKKILIFLATSLVISQVNFMAVLRWINDMLLHNIRIQEKIALYQDQAVESIFSITFLLRIFILFLYYIVVYRSYSNNVKNRVMLNGYFYGITIFLIFNSIPILAIRSSAIFRCFELIMVAEILVSIYKNEVKPLRWLSVVREKGLTYCQGKQLTICYKMVDIGTNINCLSFIGICVLFVYYFYKFITTLLIPGYFTYFSI